MAISANQPTGQPRRADAIFTATLELLVVHGYDNLTMEAVARESGVNKTTLYRWWPSKDDLLGAALTASDLLMFSVPDTGALRDDLLAVAREIAGLLTGEATAPIAATVLTAASSRPQLALLGQAFFADRLAREQPIFDRAVARGELPPTAVPATIMDMLAGALWFRVLLRNEPLTGEYLCDAVDMVLHGAARSR